MALEEDMKKALFIITATLFFATAFAQSIYKITITNTGQVETIAIEPENNVIINVSTTGTIKNWGYDVYKERGTDNNLERLEAYHGNTSNYDVNDNEALRGKPKYIGRTLVSYYASYESEEFAGKLKSIGNIYFDYYNLYENEEYQGKIKTLGTNTVTWFSSFESEAYRGKLKAMGSTRFDYYPLSADKAFRGKLKKINNTLFEYYSSFEINGSPGGLKYGSHTYYFNGIKYFIKY